MKLVLVALLLATVAACSSSGGNAVSPPAAPPTQTPSVASDPPPPTVSKPHVSMGVRVHRWYKVIKKDLIAIGRDEGTIAEVARDGYLLLVHRACHVLQNDVVRLRLDPPAPDKPLRRFLAIGTGYQLTGAEQCIRGHLAQFVTNTRRGTHWIHKATRRIYQLR